MRGPLLLLVVGACAAAEVPQPTVLDANRTGIALEQLQQGRALYLDKCTRCHTAVGPKTIRGAEWPAHVAEMSERAKLTQADHDLIVRYLVTVAPAP